MARSGGNHRLLPLVAGDLPGRQYAESPPVRHEKIMSPNTERQRGVYGFRYQGAQLPPGLLAYAGPDWPMIHIDSQIGRPDISRRWLDHQSAGFPLVGNGHVRIDREPAAGTFITPEPLSADALVHPYLVPVAAVHGHWRGYLCFHAGAVAVDGQAWGILGYKEAGKSSLLGEFARLGFQIVADDLLVVSNGNVFAGPRSVDLRNETALQFGDAEFLGTVGQRPRWRLRLGPVADTVPMRGWVFPTWSDGLAVRTIAPAERLSRLLGILTVKVPPVDPAAILPLAALPAFELQRPRRWAELPASAQALLEAIVHTSRPD